MARRIPVVDCTDLYHPHQDVGDNFDIVAAYALPEIDLRAVILDVTNRFRQPSCPDGPPGPREPGFIPLSQMNYIFNRQVPFAVSPFEPMLSPEDEMRDAPLFQQAGIDLLLRTLREASEPIDILIFCSCRTVAAAFNREPELFRSKVGRIHLSAGTSSGEIFDVNWGEKKRLPLEMGSSGYREWNVELDVHAFVCLLRSGLPLALYPCASDCGPFALQRHNTYYQFGNLSFIRQMKPRLRSYLAYALTRQLRHDFLRAMELDPDPEVLDEIDAIPSHAVWETAIWLEVTGRKLVKRPGIGYRFVTADDVLPDDTVLKNDQAPCRIEVHDDGRFDFELTKTATGVTIYDRGDDLEENERAMREALTALYLGFQP
jgi:hypothetical protein